MANGLTERAEAERAGGGVMRTIIYDNLREWGESCKFPSLTVCVAYGWYTYSYTTFVVAIFLLVEDLTLD